MRRFQTNPIFNHQIQQIHPNAHPRAAQEQTLATHISLSTDQQPLLLLRCLSRQIFIRIHQPKVALLLPDKIVLILQNHFQSTSHSQPTQMIHSTIDFAFQRANSQVVVSVNLPIVQKTLKVSLQIRRNRTLYITTQPFLKFVFVFALNSHLGFSTSQRYLVN
jgi:hypothetical protein